MQPSKPFNLIVSGFMANKFNSAETHFAAAAVSGAQLNPLCTACPAPDGQKFIEDHHDKEPAIYFLTCSETVARLHIQQAQNNISIHLESFISLHHVRQLFTESVCWCGQVVHNGSVEHFPQKAAAVVVENDSA